MKELDQFYAENLPGMGGDVAISETTLQRPRFPTLAVCGNHNVKGASATSGGGIATVLGGAPNPEWCEWLMGWPMGWTDLQPLETDKFHQWLHSHGEL